MESLLRRLKFYGIGFGFGLIFIFFFFQNRGCSWLPGNRVKNAILDRVLVVSQDSKAEMDKLNINNDQLIEALNTGDILFSESDKDEKTKCYIIESEGMKYGFTLPVESFVSEVFVANEKTNFRITKKGFGEFIRFPMDDDLVYIDTNKLVRCQQEILEVESAKEILALIQENGRINFAESDFSVEPKAEHIIEFYKGEKQIKAKTIWYKNKLDVLNFEFVGSDTCNDNSLEVGE
tara:strand:+ start:1064 stop:1768 length:705 start_codon:yes stop_codon:yes gene_type:complete